MFDPAEPDTWDSPPLQYKHAVETRAGISVWDQERR